jgi:hypothetical protein
MFPDAGIMASVTDCAAPRHDGQDDPPPAETGARLCRPCTTGLRRDLRDLPGLGALLEQSLDPGAAANGGHGDGIGLPFNDSASEVLSQIRHDLQVWVKWVLDEREPPSCPVLTLPAMCGWLSGWVAWVSRRPWAGEMAGALADDRAWAFAIVQPWPRAEIPIPADVNWCPRCGVSGWLYAVVYSSPGDRRPSVVACGSCGHEWDTVQWLRLGRDILRHVKEAA